MKIIFDVETNGFKPELASVLSFSAVLIDDDCNVVETMDRYYFCKEKENPHAIKVNGLSSSAIFEKRNFANYPEHFGEDGDINVFFSKADTMIAHNLKFDAAFLRHNHIGCMLHKKGLCTMHLSAPLYGGPDMGGRTKYPKLSEAALWAGVDAEAMQEETGLAYHDSLFDVLCTLEVYRHLVKVGAV